MPVTRYVDQEISQIMFDLVRGGRRHWSERDLRRRAEQILGRRTRTAAEAEHLAKYQDMQRATAAQDISTWLEHNATAGYLYVGTITLPNGPTYTKLGISKSPTSRTRDHERNGFEITHRWEVQTYATAQAIEREVLEWARAVSGFDARRDADWLEYVMPQGGYTELTTLDPHTVAGAIDALVERHDPPHPVAAESREPFDDSVTPAVLLSTR